jgi:transposase InsO family protein
LKFVPSECTLGVSNICNANAMMPCSSFSYSNTRGVTRGDNLLVGPGTPGVETPIGPFKKA